MRKIGCVTKKVVLGSAWVRTRLARLMLIEKEAVHISRWGVDRLRLASGRLPTGTNPIASAMSALSSMQRPSNGWNYTPRYLGRLRFRKLLLFVRIIYSVSVSPALGRFRLLASLISRLKLPQIKCLLRLLSSQPARSLSLASRLRFLMFINARLRRLFSVPCPYKRPGSIQARSV